MLTSVAAVFSVALQMLASLDSGCCLLPLEINPYETVFRMLLREPPIKKHNFIRDNDEIKEQWLEQPVDHFDANNSQTWLMRYLVNDHFYRPGGAVFVFVGGEWEIGPHVLQSGHFYDMAKQQEALMFYTEHRFYGQSWPEGNTSTQNLKYLNVLQALEDLKTFLNFKKSSVQDLGAAKVALVGGSYSGSMVTWFMQLYPQMADVAWASSAPLMAKMDFSEYMSAVMASIMQKGGAICGLRLEEAFKGLSQMMRKDTASSLLQRFKMCKSFDSSDPLNRQAFFNGLGNYFASLVQSYSFHIPKFCSQFTKLSSNPTEALIIYLTELFVSSAELKIREEDNYCLDFSYEGMKSLFTNETERQTGTRPWFYQTCHEFGWFATTSSANLVHNEKPSLLITSSKISTTFGGEVPLTYFQQLCQDVFANYSNDAHNLGHGKKTPSLTLQQLHERAVRINKLFGGFSKVSKRVIFTHGLLDPWRSAGLQFGPNVLLIKGYSHVEDMGSINFQDTVEMNVIKLKVASFINRNLRRQISLNK